LIQVILTALEEEVDKLTAEGEKLNQEINDLGSEYSLKIKEES